MLVALGMIVWKIDDDDVDRAGGGGVVGFSWLC